MDQKKRGRIKDRVTLIGTARIWIGQPLLDEKKTKKWNRETNPLMARVLPGSNATSDPSIQEQLPPSESGIKHQP